MIALKTEIILMEEDNIDIDAIKLAAEFIKNGEIIAFPTETVYGLGANALDEEAVKKIFMAKGRPQDNPLIIHVNSFNIEPYVKNIPHKAKRLMEEYWPGPLTLILEKSDLIPYTTSANLDTIGIRMPRNNVALNLIRECGVPIAAPSANLSGKPSTTTVSHCIEDLKGKIPYILGGEESEVGIESTIVDCTSDTLCVLRPGAITLDMLKKIDSNAYIDPQILGKVTENFKPKAPGMKYRHYAPKAPLKIIKGDMKKTIEKINDMVQNYMEIHKKVGIIATEETKDAYNKGAIILSVGSRERLEEVAYNLFNILREFDNLGVDYILSESFLEEEIGVAIMNRLKKSAGFNIEEI